ncbi:MAG: peptide-methionine (S)-S-oxide reductase, partial [Chitinophagales bacterium]
YYHNDAQKVIAEKSKRELAPTIWNGKITTEIAAIDNYSAAEDYHQNYFNEHSSQGYCAYVINPKVQKLKKKFGEKLKEEYMV